MALSLVHANFKPSADLNDDGAVDGTDYNIILRAFSGQKIEISCSSSVVN